MSLELQVEKLSPKPGDTIIVKFPPDMPQNMVSALIRAAQNIGAHTGCLVSVVPNTLEVTVQTEEPKPSGSKLQSAEFHHAPKEKRKP